MKITLCGSAYFNRKVKELEEELTKRGHKVYTSAWSNLSVQEIEARKNNREKFINELKPKLIFEYLLKSWWKNETIKI